MEPEFQPAEKEGKSLRRDAAVCQPVAKPGMDYGRELLLQALTVECGGDALEELASLGVQSCDDHLMGTSTIGGTSAAQCGTDGASEASLHSDVDSAREEQLHR